MRCVWLCAGGDLDPRVLPAQGDLASGDAAHNRPPDRGVRMRSRPRCRRTQRVVGVVRGAVLDGESSYAAGAFVQMPPGYRPPCEAAAGLGYQPSGQHVAADERRRLCAVARSTIFHCAGETRPLELARAHNRMQRIAGYELHHITLTSWKGKRLVRCDGCGGAFLRSARPLRWLLAPA
jgi:hypothetical protein